MIARVSKTNQRATGDRKVVFKSVLDNPFKVSWPYVPLNVQNMALASLVTILAGAGDYRTVRQALSRKRKRARYEAARKEKKDAKSKPDGSEMGIELTSIDGEDTDTTYNRLDDKNINTNAKSDIEHSPPPPIVAHLTFGINEVTRRLEAQAHSRRLRASVHALMPLNPTGESSSSSEPESAPLAYVFVCRADIDPPLLIAHFPDLVAACNVPVPSRVFSPVFLIPLPKQAENILADAVGLRRVSVLALDATTPSLATLSSLLTAVQPPSAPWLIGTGTRPPVHHIQTHIKQLCTTAPRDMRVAKRARAEGREAAKEKSKGKTKPTKAINQGQYQDKPGPKKRIKLVASAKSVSRDLIPS